MPLDPVIVARIVALIQDGRGQRETARIVGKSLCAVQNVYQRYEETGLITRRPGSGRKRVTTQRDDRFLVSTSLRNRTASAVLLRNQLQEVRDVNVSEWTVRRRLRAAGLSCRRMATGPPLQRRHRIARLAFARNHLAWNDEDWSNVLFSDESRFCLNGSNGRRRVWRRPGERYAPVCIDERLPFGGGSVMVWAGISSEARTDLVFIQNGSLTAHRYITEGLEDHVMPFMITMGEHGILMHDNARPHAARIVSGYLDEVGIRRFDWPALSPDMNPIEHVWDELGRRVRRHTPAPRTAQELRELLLQEWNNIDQNVILNLIQSMPRRLQTVINARGGNTRY
jgi:transposase